MRISTKAALFGTIVLVAVMAACSDGSTPKLHSMSAADRKTETDFTEDGQTYFSGTVNGVIFYGPEIFQQPPDESRRCAQRDATQAQIDASNLQFKADYVPAGFDPALESGSLCDDILRGVQRVWRTKTGEVLRASHVAGDASLVSIWNAKQIKTATISGRPSVALEDDAPEFGHRVIIIMRDSDATVWQVSGSVSMQEALKVAASLHK